MDSWQWLFLEYRRTKRRAGRKSLFLEPNGGFQHPTHLASADDGSGRLFVAEQAGRIRIVKNGAIVSTPFLDISARIGSTAGTKGLLSIAFPPDFVNKQHFYVNYTTSSGYLVIARYHVSSNPDVADPNSEQVVMMDGPFPDHYGGELSFGPVDGYLYFGIGTGSGGSPDNLGQDLTVLRGKVLRIDVETGNPATYTSPRAQIPMSAIQTRDTRFGRSVSGTRGGPLLIARQPIITSPMSGKAHAKRLITSPPVSGRGKLRLEYYGR